MPRINHALLLATVASQAMLCGIAHAQSASADKPNDAGTTPVQEVVVTANKRAERLQDVALSVTAVTGGDLNRAQALDLQDVATKVAGLDLVQGAGAFGPNTRIILRGQNAGGAGATVATVVDDVPFSFSGSQTQGAYLATDLDPYDMNRIEVLRGPQGTLYGATAEGGLIKYVTNAPDPNGYHAGLEAGGSTIAHGGDGGSGKGYLNIPLLNGAAALRASAYYEDLPGWVDNPLSKRTDVNSAKRYGGRVSLLWKPTTDLTVRATVFSQTLLRQGSDYVEVNGGTSSNPFGGVGGGYVLNSYLPATSASRAIIYSLNVDYDFHWAKLESITSYGRLKQSFGLDVTDLASLFGQPNTTLSEQARYDLKKFNQELRLVSEPGNKVFGRVFDWQVGAFYTSEDVPTLFQYITRSYPQGQPVTTALFSPNNSEVLHAQQATDYQEVAGYLDGTFHFNAAFDIEGGVRVFHNLQHDQNIQGGAFLGTTSLATLPKFRASETDVTYSVAPRWHVTADTLVYARIASGYRPGGPEPLVPNGPANLPSQFTSDSTVNYEVGLKSALFSRTLVVDVAAFYIDWSNIQVPVSVPVGGVNYTLTENSGSAISKGAEYTVTWTPLRGLTLGTVGAYTDAYFSADAAGLGAHKGDRLSYVPKFSGNLNATYERSAFADYKAFIGGTWAYTGSRFTDFSLQAIQSHQRIASYETLALQAGLRNSRYTFEIYAKNLTDERGITYYSAIGADVSGVPGEVALIRPRVLGVRLAADF